MPAVGVNLNAASGGIQETDWGQGGQGTLGTQGSQETVLKSLKSLKTETIREGFFDPFLTQWKVVLTGLTVVTMLIMLTGLTGLTGTRLLKRF